MRPPSPVRERGIGGEASQGKPPPLPSPSYTIPSEPSMPFMPPPPRIAPPAKRPPSSRSLRAFAFDPSFNWQLDTAVINQITLQVPWEELRPGPVGEYLEVVDVDPASGCCYSPV